MDELSAENAAFFSRETVDEAGQSLKYTGKLFTNIGLTMIARAIPKNESGLILRPSHGLSPRLDFRLRRGEFARRDHVREPAVSV